MVKTKTNLISCCSFQMTKKLNSKTCQISKMKSFTKIFLKKVPSLMFVRALINAFEMYMLIFFECTLGLIYFKQNFTGKKSNSWRKTSVLETLIQQSCGLPVCTFSDKDTPSQAFSFELCKMLRKNFFRKHTQIVTFIEKNVEKCNQVCVRVVSIRLFVSFLQFNHHLTYILTKLLYGDLTILSLAT